MKRSKKESKKVKQPIKPNESLIELEIKWLEANKSRIPRRTGFGDDHWEAIDAQLDVLRKRMSCWKAEGEYPLEVGREGEEDFEPGVAENIHSAAREAALWLEGAQGAIKPSDNWGELVDAKQVAPIRRRP